MLLFPSVLWGAGDWHLTNSAWDLLSSHCVSLFNPLDNKDQIDWALHMKVVLLAGYSTLPGQIRTREKPSWIYPDGPPSTMQQRSQLLFCKSLVYPTLESHSTSKNTLEVRREFFEVLSFLPWIHYEHWEQLQIHIHLSKSREFI